MTNALTFLATCRLQGLPAPADPEQAARHWEQWHQNAAAAGSALGDAMREAQTHPLGQAWLTAIFGNSPFLSRLALRDPEIVIAALTSGPDPILAEIHQALNHDPAHETKAQIMARLRLAKRRTALIAGLADIGGLWALDQVTGALSRLAALALDAGLRHLLRAGHASGQIALADPAQPLMDCGIIVLGMGKLGADELNYSSDIDLIILYDPDGLCYQGRDSLPEFMTRLTRDLMRLMEERTADGYVFRTDLRLRPDPASTPPAISVVAAEGYYGSIGQNWERAALIKARPIAGDLAAGRAFLAVLTPFIWRKHLDFAAIRDIHSIKRQINARHGGNLHSIAGHNVKLGLGGIREIEFFVQTQQLIWGGRLPALRCAGTVAGLHALVAAGRIEAETAEELISAYHLLRHVEHRLQMIDDAQTHSLPTDPGALARLAVFLGYADLPAFTAALTATLARVRRHFGALFRDAPTLSAHGNLVFTGKDNDPDTLSTLRDLGFTDPVRVAETLRGWQYGRIRATRSAQSREILTELTPRLLQTLAKSADPDFAFIRFDEFISHLPAGVQLFTLFQHHPELLQLVGEIMGEAPFLAVQLARKPLLLDAVLFGDFFGLLPDSETAAIAALSQDLDLVFARARDFEDVLDLCRRWAADRKFQIGVQLLQGRIDGERSGRDLALVAEAVIQGLLPRVEADFARAHGRIAGSGFIILGLGKLGSREMTAQSDLDLIFLFDAPEDSDGSDGPRPLAVSSYFARLGQRVINALTALTAEGSLYTVDMRLRPSGNAGPIASSFVAFQRYHAEQAWTWERQALTRARIIAGSPSLAQRAHAEIYTILTQPRDPNKLLLDVAQMRQRITKQHPNPSEWDCKHRRGGLIDLEFLAQYLLLRWAPEDPSLLTPRTAQAFERLVAAGILAPETGAGLLDALRLWHRLQGLLRVSLGPAEGQEQNSDLLERILVRAVRAVDAASRRQILNNAAGLVGMCYDDLISWPAEVLMHSSATTTEVTKS